MRVRVEARGAVTTVILSRPDARNAVDRKTGESLLQAFETFDGDASQHVAVLWGEGGTFCAGYDLKEAAALAQSGAPPDPEGEGPMGPTRRLLSKPVIAAVEGHAVAGGLELASWCDLRVAARDAVFGVFCRRWGVPLIDGGTVRLPRIVGQGRALDMILTGRGVPAEEAHAWGLVDRLVEPGEALSVAQRLAEQIAAFPQVCLRVDRASAYGQWGLDLPAALRAEAEGGLRPLREEARSGATRFVRGQGRGGSFD